MIKILHFKYNQLYEDFKNIENDINSWTTNGWEIKTSNITTKENIEFEIFIILEKK